MSQHDIDRLQAVNRFLELDINRKEELQEMVELASALCYTPIAMITLIDDVTEHIKFSIGTALKQQPKKDTFCTYLIEGDDLMVITDASHDPRFFGHELVVKEPKIRFYAGAPLITHDGYSIGSLCVLGMIIKQLTEAQKHLLKVLAKRVVEIMELAYSLQLLKKQFLLAKYTEKEAASFFENAGTCHLFLSRGLEVIAYNKNMAVALEKNLTIKLYTGLKISQVFKKEALEIFIGECQEALSGNPVNYERKVEYLHETIWWSVSFEPCYNAEGEIIGISYNSTDITARKLQEQHMAVKNETLLKIAHIQSYELCKPVASILGLMEVFKSSDYSSSKEELMMLGRAATDLDVKIRAIVSLTE